MTNRQFRTWLVWQAICLNRPDRRDYYSMQQSCEVRRVLAKDPGSIKISDFKIQFGGQSTTHGYGGKEDRQEVEDTRENRDRANAFAHAKWIGAFAGRKVRGLNAPHPVDGSQVSGGKKP